MFIHHRNQVTLFEDVLPALENLAQRFVLGAITNGNACIHRTGLDHVLGFSVAAADVGAAKPDAAIFREACRRCQVKSHEIVHIGDDPARDVAGAAAAGLRTVWVNRSGQAWTGKQRPDAEIHDLRELEDVLPRL